MSLEEKQQRYLDLMHAMQTGVMYEMNKEPLSPRYSPDEIQRAIKHLRVGINSALMEVAAMTEILEAKGIITLDELMDKRLEKLEQEVRSYEELLSKRYGATITLG